MSSFRPVVLKKPVKSTKIGAWKRTENPRVAGSIPALGIEKKHREIGVFLVFTGVFAVFLYKIACLD